MSNQKDIPLLTTLIALAVDGIHLRVTNVLQQVVLFSLHHLWVKSLLSLYFRSLTLILLVLAGCSSHRQQQPSALPSSSYQNWITKAANYYKVDAKLIHAIIQVESGFNPKAVSPSKAIGLMQIKASTAGCDAYRYKGKSGCPREKDLFDPAINIDLGTAYLSTLQIQFNNIKNPLTRRYATTVAYANGAGALLRTFSSNRQTAIKIINHLSPEDFHWHIRQHHPSPQALRYMLKIEQAYNHL